MAPAAFSSIPKSGQSLFFTAHPPPQLDAGLIAYLFISAFSQLRTHTGAGWGEAEAGSPGRPKKTRGVQLPPFPQGQEEAGKRKAGSRKGGDAGSIAHPLCFVRTLREIKNSCIHRVAASATKSVLSGGSCKLFAAPGNQHLGLQSPPGPFLPCQKQPLPFSNPHVSCQQSANTGSPPGKKGGTRFDFVSCFVALFNSRPQPPL